MSPDPGAESSVRREYQRRAPRYDRRWARYIDVTVRETLARFEPRPDERILDIGCGTGVLLERLHHRDPGLALTGIDPVAEMLEIARHRLPPSVDLRESSAEALPFSEASFDAVVSTSALHYFGDPPRALGEMRRVLRPGGRLVITDWCGDYLGIRAVGMWARAIGGSRVRIFSAQSLRAALEASTFNDVTVERYKIDPLWGMMTACATK